MAIALFNKGRPKLKLVLRDSKFQLFFDNIAAADPTIGCLFPD